MYFDNLQSFFSMGGYGTYVWSAVGVTLLAMFLITVHSVFEHKQIKRQLHEQILRQQRIAKAREMPQNKEMKSEPTA